MYREYPERQQLIFEEEKNILRNFGVTKDTLFKANPRVLKDLFRGVNNLEIPRGMWEYLNPEEGLAIYFKIADLKRYHIKSIPQELMRLIPYINKQAWENLDFAWLSHQFEHPFSRMPGSQKPRLEKIASEDVDKFLSEVFDNPYRYSLSEHSFEGEYYDPNGDAWGRINKELYVKPIYNHVKGIYNSKK